MMRGFESFEQAVTFYYDPAALTHDKLLLPKNPPQPMTPEQIPLPPPTVPLYYSDIVNFPDPDPRGEALSPDEVPESYIAKVVALGNKAMQRGKAVTHRVEMYFRNNGLSSLSSEISPELEHILLRNYFDQADLKAIARAAQSGTPSTPSRFGHAPRLLDSSSYTDRLVSCKSVDNVKIIY